VLNAPHRVFVIEEIMENSVQVDNPYGIEALWQQGDIVARGTLCLLLIMSAVSWYIIFTKLWDQRRLKQGAKVVEKQFWSSGSLKEAVDRLPKDNDFRAVAEDGLRASAHHEGRLTDRIGVSGQASIDKVAGPVGEALIMTALGLAVAVPAVMGYNWLLRRNKTISESLRNFASDLHAYLVGGARVSQGAPVAGVKK
jgi:biopolymer transport protein ExbB